MSNTIVIVTKTGVIDLHEDKNYPNPEMYDGLIEAQDEHGQVTWDCMGQNIAIGFIGTPADGVTETNRIAVISVDLADALDQIRVVSYVNGALAEVPELVRFR